MVNLQSKSAKQAASRNVASNGHFYFIEVGAHFDLMFFLRQILSKRARSFSSSIYIDVSRQMFDSLFATYEDLRKHYLSTRHVKRDVAASNC